MVNKYLALQKDVFDKSKITVVGTPTITSDGVASGFSTSNYLTSSNPVTINPNNFRIDFEFTTGSNITTAQMIIRSNDGQNAFIIGLQNEKIRLYLQSATTGGSWDIVSGTLSSNLLTANTKYNGYLSFNGSVYTLNVNGSDWITVKSSALIRSSFALKIGQGMSAEPFLGSVNMLDIKTYSDNQLIYTPAKPTYLIERRKPKVWNKGQFTVVGNPSISDEGIASGFSSGNHILLPNAINFTSDWELKFSFVCTDILKNQRVLGSAVSGNARLGINIGFQGSNKKLVTWISTGVLSNDGWDIVAGKQAVTDFQNNQLYYIILQFKNGVYSLKSSTDNINWVTEWTVNSSLVIGTKNLALGCPIAEPDFHFHGSINLKQFKIYTDNNLVFDGGADTYVYDPSKFTIVGSPTITEYGVASGFKASNYIKTPLLDFSKPFEILSQFTLNTSATTAPADNYIFSTASNRYFSVAVIPNLKIRARLGNGTGWTEYATNYACNIGTKYYAKLKYDGTIFNLYISTNGKDYSLILTKELNVTYPTSEALGLGILPVVNSGEMYGSIDLPSISVTVDGKEIFTGAKENYYMLNGI